MSGSQTPIEDLSKEKVEQKPSAKKRTSSSRAKATENELRGRLADCFDRISDALETRGDDELSAIIREDAEVISAGLVSLTRPFKVLRMPLLALVAVVEPALAFGRIARVLIGRFAERRMRAREGHATNDDEQPEYSEYDPARRAYPPEAEPFA